MIINCNTCCYNGYIPNSNHYVRVINYTPLQIYFIVQYYRERTGFTTRESDIFGKNKFDKIYCPSDASEIAFNIVNASVPTRPVICNKYLGGPGFYNFKVVETSQGIRCVQD